MYCVKLLNKSNKKCFVLLCDLIASHKLNFTKKIQKYAYTKTKNHLLIKSLFEVVTKKGLKYFIGKNLHNTMNI